MLHRGCTARQQVAAPQVAGGAAGVVQGELDAMQRLSPSGAQQLAADLEYLCNVLSALGVDVPRTLPTWQVTLPRLYCA